jgi:enoyl-CoA hydratase
MNPALVVASQARPGVRLIRLQRPEKRNALSRALLIELAASFAAAARAPDVACIVLTGSETVFSAGADIQEMREHGFAAITDAARMDAWRAIERFPLPIVAAVNGICFGGGHELAMLADIVIAASDARFGQPEIKLGILPGDGATQRVTRLAGKALAMKLILTGEPISAAEALQGGLVAEVVPPAACLERALALAEIVASRPPIALRLAKDAVLAADESFLQGGLQIERRNIAYAFTTADQQEGMAAFFEKRQPRFSGT